MSRHFLNLLKFKEQANILHAESIHQNFSSIALIIPWHIYLLAILLISLFFLFLLLKVNHSPMKADTFLTTISAEFRIVVDTWCVHVKSLQSCLTLCDPMDCSLPGSSVHGILQARILERVVMPSSRGSSWPRDRTQVSYISCIGRQILDHWAIWEALGTQ